MAVATVVSKSALAFLAFHHIQYVLAQSQQTLGPLATVSVQSEGAYSSARPCAAGCLVYNGMWVCGVNGGYNDLAKNGIGCGCGPTNNCFCSEPSRPQATSFLSSCISEWCGTTIDVNPDITSMLNLYDAYCFTATVDAGTTQTSTPAPRSAIATARTTGAGTTAAGSAATDTLTPVSGGPDDNDGGDGLKRSDIVALAASLGVGIPSILIALITLCVMIKKRRKHAAEQQLAANNSSASNVLMTSTVSQPTSTPPVMDAATEAEMAHMYGNRPTQNIGGYWTPPQARQGGGQYGRDQRSYNGGGGSYNGWTH